ncbi:MAG TPA: aspartate kinase [bacterium]|nr:aspartate kinase [bacterium]HQO91294.1 aspartate kinase [bacterium]
MKVLKFGGISVKDAPAIRKLKEILLLDDSKKLVVVSAFFGVTDLLSELVGQLKTKKYDTASETAGKVEQVCLNIAKELRSCKVSERFITEKFCEIKTLIPALALLGEITDRSVDMFMSVGEKISSFVLADFLNSEGMNSGFIDASGVIVTDNCHTKAAVDLDKTKAAVSGRIAPLFEHSNIVVTAGFIGSDPTGATTTLGRGGSDYSASVLAVCLKAEVLEIWKEVDGIMTTDPRIVKNAIPVESLSYTEASELAFFGAKVLHPKTIRAAVMEGIPVIVKKTSDPQFQGTTINRTSPVTRKVKAIAFHKNITIINICSEKMLGTYGFLSRVFDIFTKHRTPVDMITTSEINISVTVDSNGPVSDIIRELSEFSSVTATENVSIISIVGEGIKFTSGIAGRCFGSLKDINILMVSMGASEANISIIVDQSDMERCVTLLHREFFEKERKE